MWSASIGAVSQGANPGVRPPGQHPHLTAGPAGCLRGALQPVHLVVLDHGLLAVRPHPGSKLGLLLLDGVGKLVAPALRLVERPVRLHGEQRRVGKSRRTTLKNGRSTVSVLLTTGTHNAMKQAKP